MARARKPHETTPAGDPHDAALWDEAAFVAAERARMDAALAHTLRTDTRFARAYALMGKEGLTWLHDAAGAIAPDTWDSAYVRQRFRITDDLQWLMLSVELYLHGGLHWCSLSGLGPSDEEPLGDYLEDSITAEGVLWLAERGR